MYIDTEKAFYFTPIKTRMFARHRINETINLLLCYFQNLELSATFPEKNEVCSRMRAYLSSPLCKEEAELRSHHLLEILLHQVALHVSMGRYKKAISVLQGPLKKKNNKETGLCRLLTIEDKVIAWLCYLSLVEFGQLPSQLYDPADSRCCRIVCKDQVYLPWRKKTKITVDKLHAMFREAIKTCVYSSEIGVGICQLSSCYTRILYCWIHC